MRLLLLPSDSSRALLVLCNILFIALVIPILSNPRAAEPTLQDEHATSPNQSIERNMIRMGHPPLPTSTPPPNAKASANIERRKVELAEMRRDSATLADLANSLKDDLAKANENMLSIETVEKADRIERLAKKIKKWTKSN